MKRLLFALFAMLIVFGSKAQTYTVDCLEFTVTDETAKTVSLIDVRSKDSLLKIPENVYIEELGANYTVTDLNVLFKYYTFFTKALIIPKSIKTISRLEGGSLRHIKFEEGSNLKSIERMQSLSSLEDINFPGSLDSIRAHTLQSSRYLTKVELGEGIKYIGEYAFENCPIEELILPSSVDSIDRYAFSCTKRVVPLRPTPPRLNKYAFKQNVNTVEVSVPTLSAMIKYQDDENWGKFRFDDFVFEQDNVKYKLDGHELSVIGNSVKKNSILTISATVTKDGCTLDVTRIYDYALNGSANEIIINAPVKSLGKTGDIDWSWVNHNDEGKYIKNCTYPFRYLKKIKLPNTLQRIEDFQFCNSPLETIDIPSSVKYIGNGAFYKSSIKHIEIPEGIDTLRSSTFAHCNNLTTAKLPESLKVIEGNKIIVNKNYWPAPLKTLIEPTFYESGITYITLPKGIENIDEKAFNYNRNLKKFTANGKTYFDRNGVLMKRTSELNGNHLILVNYPECADSIYQYNITEDIDSLGTYAFFKGNDIINITILNLSPNIKYVQGLNRNIKEINIPEGAEVIKANAFSYSPNILRLPKSLKCIESNAFNCRIVFLAGNTPVRLMPTYTYNDNEQKDKIAQLSTTFCVEASALKAYKEDSVWSIQKVISTDNIYQDDKMIFTEQPDGSAMLATYNHEPIGELTIPAQVEIKGTKRNVTAIGPGSLFDLRLLTKVSIPSTIDSICEGAFSQCYNLKNVEIDKNCKMSKIKNSAFYVCFSLEEFTLPATVKIIGESAFSGNIKLKSFNIPYNSNLDYIGSGGLANLDISTIYIPAQTRVGSRFLDGTEVKDINLDAANPYYKYTEDVLYSIACDTVKAYAAGKRSEAVVINKNTKYIESFFFNADYLKKMYLLSETIPIIRGFSYTGSVDPSYDYVNIECNLVAYVRESIYDEFIERYPIGHLFKDIIAISDKEADEMTTDIKEIENTKSPCEINAYYNLNGYKTTKPSKGIYIHNGKKIISDK